MVVVFFFFFRSTSALFWAISRLKGLGEIKGMCINLRDKLANNFPASGTCGCLFFSKGRVFANDHVG